MAYIRTHETKQTSRGKVVKRYEVVNRCRVRDKDGSVVMRLRQESHATREAAEARLTELNAAKHTHTTDPGEQRKQVVVSRAIDELLARKPHLASRRPTGEIGQGASPSATTVDLAAMLRQRAN